MREEINRIAEQYKERDREMHRRGLETNIYNPRHPLGQLFHEHNNYVLIQALNRLDIDLEKLKVLDLGCGYGTWLRRLVELGAQPENLTGLDISEERIAYAKKANPAIAWVHSSEETLPFPSGAFDMVMQVVVFSSILDEDLCSSTAAEMSRVLKPGGYIFWIDKKKPHADRLAGFSKARVLDLFPGTSVVYEVAVHPRYFRRLYGRFGWLCRLLYGFTAVQCESWFFVLEKER